MERLPPLTHNFNEIEILSDEVIENMNNELLMTLLYRHRNSDIGDKLYKIIEKFKNDKDWGVYDTPDEWFEDKKYSTFMDFFKRDLSHDKLEEIKSKDNELSIPCECNIESIGSINDPSSIVRLKKPSKDVVSDLEKCGIAVDNFSFINMKLLKVYYHIIHSPISGEVKDIIQIPSSANFFGKNIVWVVSIYNDQYGYVYLMLIGELSIQDFEFCVSKGDMVGMYDKLGNFDWASQVVLLFDAEKFDVDMSISDNMKYFVGDKIY